jgi:hypothetical protein
VHAEHLVVGLGGDQVALGGHQLQPDAGRERPAQREHQRDAHQEQDGDPLVVDGEEPGPHGGTGGQAAGRRWARALGCHRFSTPPSAERDLM